MSLQELPSPLAQPIRSSSQTMRRGWWLVGVQIVLLLGIAALLWPTTASLLVAWEDTQAQTYTHGYLIAALCVYLIARNRDLFDHVASRPSWSAAGLLLCGSLAWLIAWRAGIQVIHQILLPLLAWLAIWTACGARVARISAFAVGYLLFAVQIWGSINGLLQSGTVIAVDILLRITGVPAFVQDNFVHLAVGDFEIAGGCSGLHFFIVALAIAALYGEVNRDTSRVRLLLLGIAALGAIVTNWLRVYLIVLAGHLTAMEHYLVRVDHVKFGWALFAVMIAGFLLVARRMPLAPESDVPSGGSSPAAASAYVFSTALALTAAAIGPLCDRMAQHAEIPAPIAPAMPVAPVSWQGPVDASSGTWQPRFVGADLTNSAEYQSGERRVEWYAATYAWQGQGKELIGYDNTLLGPGDELVGSEVREVGGASVIETRVRRQESTSLIWSFYEVGGARTTGSFAAQMQYAWRSLVGTPASRVIALRSECRDDCEAARAALAEILGAASSTRAHE